jgi:PAS domain S-box-containing protein
MDETGNVEWVNKAFTNIYGRTIEELTATKGNNICDFSEYENIKELIKKVSESSAAVTYSNQSTKPDGSKIYVQTSLSPVLTPEGAISKLVAVEADITALQEAQEKILFQKEEIEKRKEEVEKQSKDILDSIQYAGRIQKALLPPEAGIKNFLPEHFILFLPRDIVSGDFYWIHQINSKIIIVAADCTGHGVPGAFMSMLGISLLNEIVIKNKNTQPDIILDKLRFNVKKALHQTGHQDTSQDGMDIALAVFDKETHTFEFSGAYNPMLQIRNNEILTFKGDKMPIGVHRRDSEPFTLTKNNYTKDDVFYFFSDGYPDQIGETTGRKYLHKNFSEFLLKIHGKPMQNQKIELSEEFFNWKKQYFQVDDVLVIGFKIE